MKIPFKIKKVALYPIVIVLFFFIVLLLSYGVPGAGCGGEEDEGKRIVAKESSPSKSETQEEEKEIQNIEVTQTNYGKINIKPKFITLIELEGSLTLTIFAAKYSIDSNANIVIDEQTKVVVATKENIGNTDSEIGDISAPLPLGKWALWTILEETIDNETNVRGESKKQEVALTDTNNTFTYETVVALKGEKTTIGFDLAENVDAIVIISDPPVFSVDSSKWKAAVDKTQNSFILKTASAEALKIEDDRDGDMCITSGADVNKVATCLLDGASVSQTVVNATILNLENKCNFTTSFKALIKFEDGSSKSIGKCKKLGIKVTAKDSDGGESTELIEINTPTEIFGEDLITAITDNLIGHWAFDDGEGSTIYDSSGNDIDGTMENNYPGNSNSTIMEWIKNNDNNGYLRINGKKRIQIPYNDLLVMEKYVTITANIKFEPVTIYSSYDKLFSITRSNLPSENGNYSFWLRKSGTTGSTAKGQLNIAHKDSSGTVYSLPQSSTSSLLEFGKWYNIATVIDTENNRRIIYLNGKNVGDNYGDVPYMNYSNSGNLYFIADKFSNSTMFNSSQLSTVSIDEIRLYNSPLSDTEIEEIYKNDRKKMFDPVNSLALHWDFNSTANEIITGASSVNAGTRSYPSYLEGIGYDNSGSYSFNGLDNYLSFNSPKLLSQLPIGSSPRSFSIRFKQFTDKSIFIHYGDGNSVGEDFIFENYNQPTGGTSFARYLFESPGTADLSKYATLPDTEASPVYLPGDTDPTHWSHVVITIDGITLRYYLNCNLMTTKTPKSSSPSTASLLSSQLNTVSSTVLNIGKRSVVSSGFTYSSFSGYIDDIAIYNKALSADEVGYICK